MPKYTKRSVALITAGVVAVGGAGAAFAWTLSGGGNALANSAEIVPLSVSGVSSTALVPNNWADITVRVSNPNTFPVEVTGLTLTGVTSTQPGCANFIELQPGTLPAAIGDVTVGAKTSIGNGTKEITSTNALRMKADAPNSCAGATFNFTVDLDGQTVGNTFTE